MRILFAVALALNFASPTAAQPSSIPMRTGNDFIKSCSSDEPTIQTAACLFYVRGLFDAFQLARSMCPPDGVTYQQMLEVGRKAIQENPQNRHKPVAFLVWESWFNAFPCQKS